MASPLLEAHTAEVLRSELVQQINGTGSMSFGPPRPAPPGGAHTPGQCSGCQRCNRKRCLCQACNTVAVLPELQPAAIAGRYNALLDRFQDPAFLTSGDYLLDMGGHELLATLSRFLHGLGAPGPLNQGALANELLRVLALMYQPNTIYQPDDFADLAVILAHY